MSERCHLAERLLRPPPPSTCHQPLPMAYLLPSLMSSPPRCCCRRRVLFGVRWTTPLVHAATGSHALGRPFPSQTVTTPWEGSAGAVDRCDWAGSAVAWTSPRPPFRTPTRFPPPTSALFVSTLYSSDAASVLAVSTCVTVLVSSAVQLTAPSAEPAAVSAAAMEAAADVAAVERREENTRDAARRTGAPLQTLRQKWRHPDRRMRLSHRRGVQPPRPEGRGASC